MTMLDQEQGTIDQGQQSGSLWTSGGGDDRPGAHKNVGPGERLTSLAAGAILVGLGLSRRSAPGAIIAGVGGLLAYRGLTGHCHVYGALGLSSVQPEDGEAVEREVAARGVRVEQALQVNRPAEELYRHWRDFENLPGFMHYLESVRVLDDRRSHWVTKAPRIAGGRVEWDAEITRDEPGRLIAWRSLPGSDIDQRGEIRFEAPRAAASADGSTVARATAPEPLEGTSDGLADRGTEVHVTLSYVPPAGKVGHWVATLLGKSPDLQVREDLRNFKRLMETGEVPTIIGQPHGTCTGVGEEYTE